MSTASWFREALATWYAEARRPLPWRSVNDPYLVWISEVVLQQTRVDQGMGYWYRFVERFPTVHHLAEASEDEVLRLWQGLGYYGRARNLHRAAQQLVTEHGGVFPADHAALLGLKGVGDYTAAAIGSICFGLREPVVDGNVYRVLARVFDRSTPIDSTRGRNEFRGLAAELLDPKAPGDHNQAVMELGALVCTPRDPDCGNCPLRSNCLARIRGRIKELPVKAGRTKVRTRYFNYLHMEDEGTVLLSKRMGKDIWQGLYELPLVETAKPATRRSLVRALDPSLASVGLPGAPAQRSTHLLSHQRIEAAFWKIAPLPKADLPAHWLRVPLAQLDRYALPRPIERYLLEE